MSPADIKEENSKRRLLAKKYNQKSNTKIIKDPNAPKRPTTAYLRFALENMVPGVSIGDSAKENGQRWKLMSEADKRV
jgi:hypothetical protein